MRRSGGKSVKERGSNLVEFIFCAPILLMISGATVDISRYIRYTQVTNFISQQGADLLYRKCSDITIYDRPTITSTRLSINAANTNAAVFSCARQIQNAMQSVLNNSVYGALAMTTVLRYDIALQSTGTCRPTPLQPTVRALTDLDREPEEDDAPEPDEEESDDNEGKERREIKVKPHQEDDDESGDDGHKGKRRNFSDSTQASNLNKRRLALSDQGDVTLNGKTVISASDACSQRQRLVIVEASYPYDPIVKFLPNFLTIDPGNQGNHRETTIL